MELERHIEILLLDNDCVVVPSLGGFVAHYTEARYDKRDGMMLPPMRALGFNPALKMNDSLLAQSYIEAYDISYPEAIDRIEDEVNELRQSIEDEGFRELSNIGTLRLNPQGSYDFEPCEAGILTPSLYGLSGIEVKPVGSKAGAEHHAADAEAPSLSTSHTAATAALYGEDDSERVVRIRVSTIRNAVAVAAAALAFAFVSLPLNDNARKEMSTFNLHTEALTQMLPKTMVNTPGKAEPVKATTAASHTTLPTAACGAKAGRTLLLTPKTTVEAAPAPYYTLVLASQVSRKNADEFVSRLHQSGFGEAAVYTRNATTRVIYNHFATESEAYRALRSLRGVKAFREAWVYRVNG